MIILPAHTAEQAETFTEAFQDWLSESAPAINGIYRIRVSCGFAVYPEDAHSRHELLAAADARLYKNKRQHSLHSQAVERRKEGPALGVYGLLDRIVESVHSRDPYSRAHCELTADYALVLTRHLGLSPTAQKTLRLAALLHDVGKIGVPEGLLSKPGPLSEHEFEVVKHQLVSPSTSSSIYQRARFVTSCSCTTSAGMGQATRAACGKRSVPRPAAGRR
jgi:HD-GYP domain-containing protein (c-di-GMP phosphodiesterase class II)